LASTPKRIHRASLLPPRISKRFDRDINADIVPYLKQSATVFATP